MNEVDFLFISFDAVWLRQGSLAQLQRFWVDDGRSR